MSPSSPVLQPDHPPDPTSQTAPPAATQPRADPPDRTKAAPDAELEAEQAHLSASRAGLARMRARTSALDTRAAGDWVSQIVLESAFARRRKALEDDPTVPLFFGRLNFDEDHAEARGDTFYIGRRHVTDEAGDPMVVDWRARISRAFYRASRAEPMGVRRRRRFGFHAGALTAFEDEHLLAGAATISGTTTSGTATTGTTTTGTTTTGTTTTGAAPLGEGAARSEYSALLEAEIERPRVGPMRDIVATIQPEQDLIVRAPLEESVCVQGAPGTGKTAVGLHRAAYLLYTHRDQLSRQGILVVGPNASFLRYIADVLPALGEIDAEHSTIEDLVTATLTRLNAKYLIRTEDHPAVATLKGDPRMATVVQRALWSHLRPPTEGLMVPRGARRWRVHGYEAEEIVDGLRAREVRYGAARAMLAQRLAHAVLVKMELSGDSPDDRVQDAIARSRPVRSYVEQVWPAVDPARLVHRLLSDEGFLAAAAADVLSPSEQRPLLWDKPPKSAASARWSVADAVLIDEAADLLARTPSLGHVVADEAQDLSAMMLRAVGRRCATGSTTVLGDLAQATTPWGSRSWDEALRHLGKPEAHVEQLTVGFRVPGDVIDYAARLLATTAPQLAPPTSVRRSRGELAVRRVTDVVAEAVVAVRDPRLGVGSIGVIVPDGLVTSVSAALSAAGVAHAVLGEPPATETSEFDSPLDVVPATLAKGLEFDNVVLLEPASIVAVEEDRVPGLRRLYVCLTRAVTSLVVLHELDLPEELGAPTAGSGVAALAASPGR